MLNTSSFLSKPWKFRVESWAGFNVFLSPLFGIPYLWEKNTNTHTVVVGERERFPDRMISEKSARNTQNFLSSFVCLSLSTLTM